MDNNRNSNTDIPKFIGGKLSHYSAMGSFMSKSRASSSIIGYGHDPTPTPPNPFLFESDSSLSSVTAPQHGYSEHIDALSVPPPDLPPSIVANSHLGHNGETFLTQRIPNLPHPSIIQSPDKISTSTATVVLEHTNLLAKNVYEQNGNDKVMLIIMSIGLTIDTETPKPLYDIHHNDIFNPKKNPALKHNKYRNPFKCTLVDEAKRRSKLHKNMLKVAMNKPKQYYMNWLTANPRQHPNDLTFLFREAEVFHATLVSTLVRPSPSGSGNSTWRGEAPRIRLIECILDDEIRAALVKDKAALTREELDGRNNTDTARPDIWQMVSDKWNDDTFQPVASVYPGLHPDFKERVRINLHDMTGMGKCTSRKAKKKFQDLRVQLCQVKIRHTNSGMGDGAKKVDPELLDSDDDSDCNLMGGGSNRADFLGIYKSAVLYLWERADECDFLQDIVQKLDKEIGLNGGMASTITTATMKANAKRKEIKDVEDRERKEDEGRALLLKAVQENNRSVKTISMVMIRKQIYDATMDKLKLHREGLLDAMTSKVINDTIAELKSQLGDEIVKQHVTQERGNTRTVTKKRKTHKLTLTQTSPIDLCGESTTRDEEEEGEEDGGDTHSTTTGEGSM